MDSSGPIEIVVLELSGAPGGEVAEAMAEAVDGGAVRILDLLFVRRDDDGTIRGLELSEAGDEAAAPWAALDGEVLGLVNDEDLEAVGQALPPGGSAALIVYEHVWARRLAAALGAAGGSIALRQHIPAADAEAALAALQD